MNNSENSTYGGPERRSSPRIPSRPELEQLAERVADRCINRTFELFGVDATDKKERDRLRANLTFLDEFRLGVGTIKKTVWGAIGTGLVGLVYLGFKKSGGG